MKNGCVKIGKYNSTPNINGAILNKEEFNIVKWGEDTICISKEPEEIKET